MLGIIFWVIQWAQRVIRRRAESRQANDTSTLFLIEMGMQHWR